MIHIRCPLEDARIRNIYTMNIIIICDKNSRAPNLDRLPDTIFVHAQSDKSEKQKLSYNPRFLVTVSYTHKSLRRSNDKKDSSEDELLSYGYTIAYHDQQVSHLPRHL